MEVIHFSWINGYHGLIFIKKLTKSSWNNVQKRNLEKRTCKYGTETVRCMSLYTERCERVTKTRSKNKFLPPIHSLGICRSQSVWSSKSMRERSLEAKLESDRSLDQNSSLLRVPNEHKRSSYPIKLHSLY